MKVQTRDICEVAVRQRGSNIYHVSDTNSGYYEELAMIAIKQDSMNWYSIKKQTPKLRDFAEQCYPKYSFNIYH